MKPSTGLSRNSVLQTAVISRIAIFLIQYIGNLLIPDHDAGVFIFCESKLEYSVLDQLVQHILGGFIRWDAQYFVHIVKHGYTFENTLAFFPLFPLVLRIVTFLLSPFLLLINEDSLIFLAGLLINTLFFCLAALELYKLSVQILSVELAYKSTVLFCFNPASIFFTAPYTESLYSYLTFKSMTNIVCIYTKYSQTGAYIHFKDVASFVIPISLSTCTRSNGVLNVGFVGFFLLKICVVKIRRNKEFIFSIILKQTCIIIVLCSICTVPFILFQVYCYRMFCTDFFFDMPEEIKQYAVENNFVLPGMFSKNNQTWCYKKIPLAYSYIQDHYWNVGFLRYYELKQLPNFMLAFPVTAIVIYYSTLFILQHRMNIFYYIFGSKEDTTARHENNMFNVKMFVFIVHAVFLTVFNIFCIHVQVTTRILCSASPVVYWYTAYVFANVENRNFIFCKNLNFVQKLIKYYFLSYFFIGTVMFCNFLPWT